MSTTIGLRFCPNRLLNLQRLSPWGATQTFPADCGLVAPYCCSQEMQLKRHLYRVENEGCLDKEALHLSGFHEFSCFDRSEGN